MTTLARRPILPVVLLLSVLPACEAMDRARSRFATSDTVTVAGHGSGLALGLQVPGTLRPGDEGMLRLLVSNRTDSVVSRVRLELILPGWAEPMPPRWGDREVTLAALEDGGIRFSYDLDEMALQPGETQTVEQRIRVPRESPLTEGAPPWTRVVRALLLDLEGQPLAEVESQLGLDGVDDGGAAAPAAGARDRLGPVRLGMTSSAVREAVAAVRDTTWTQEGMTQRGLVVPLPEGGRTLAALSDDTVYRIEVGDPRVRTRDGLGVGSTVQELRAAHGTGCAEAAEGVVVAWFPAAPGISFALDAPEPGGVTQPRARFQQIPASARVTRWWLRRGDSRCPE
jgi:hypothetical protein